MKMAFKECFDSIEETTVETSEEKKVLTSKTIITNNIWLIISVIMITIVIIGVIIGVIVLVNRSYNKVKPQSPKADRNVSSLQSQSSSNKSDTLDEIARNLKPGQKFRVLRFKSEVLEKEMLSPIK